MKTNRLSRKEFILGIAGGGIALVVGCGDDETGTTTASGTGASGAAGATTSGPGPSSSSGAGGMSSSSGGGGTGPGGSGQGGSGGSSAMCGAVVSAAIFKNHGHQLDVPLADIDAAVDKTYDITGTASHCHQVTLTAADFMTLKSGGVVTKKTCNGITQHELVLSCAPNPPEPAAPDCSATPTEGTCM